MSLKAAAIRIFAKIVRPGAVSSVLALFFKGIFRLVPIRKKIALKNLEIALPGKTARELREILWKTYDNMIWTGLEFCSLQKDPRKVLDWVAVENESAVAGIGGGIIVGGHVGNWELCAARIAQGGHAVTAIIQESHDRDEDKTIEEMRARAGVKTVATQTSMTKALAVLKRNEFLGIMPDQHGGDSGIKVSLFGLATSTPQGPAVFAYLTKKPIIPVFIRRVRPFKHVMRYGEPIKWEDKGNREMTIREITASLNREIERMVLEAPDQWLAQHKRFKEYYGGGNV